MTAFYNPYHYYSRSVFINPSSCNRCRFCMKACPRGVIGTNEEQKVVVLQSSRCIRCMACTKICPSGAIKVKIDSVREK